MTKRSEIPYEATVGDMEPLFRLTPDSSSGNIAVIYSRAFDKVSALCDIFSSAEIKMLSDKHSNTFKMQFLVHLYLTCLMKQILMINTIVAILKNYEHYYNLLQKAPFSAFRCII